MTKRQITKFIRKSVGKILNYLSFFDHISANQKMWIRFPGVTGSFDDVELCIYVTYGESILTEDSTKLLDEIRNLGFTTMHINNSDEIFEKREAPHGLSYDRKNVGYDLAAVRDALFLIHAQPKSLLIINSSVQYLANGVVTLVNMAKEKHLDVVGITESRQKRVHLQSYFFFSQTKEGVKALSAEYSRMRNWIFKRTAVNFGELRIMENLALRGISVGALASYESILSNALNNPELVDKSVYSDIERGIDLNPTQQLWRVLFFMGIPIVKKTLINNNPSSLKFRPLDYLSAEKIYQETTRS
jgi:hypothetical protein